MTGTTIITQFELQVDDITELSTSEELIILNRVCRSIFNDRPWEFLKKEGTGSLSSDANGYYITIPTDFAYFSENYKYTDNSIGIGTTSSPTVIFVGTDYAPYKVINFADRKQYRDSAGYVYLDLINNKIRFTGSPTFSNGTTYSFDYIYIPDDIIASEEPVIPARFHDAIVFGMAVDNDIIQKSNKAKSYATENQLKYNDVIDKMRWWNAQLQMN